MKKAFLIQTALLAVAALIHFSAGTATFGADGLFSGNGIGVLWSIRLPRLLTACAAGAAMGIAGVLLQAFFRNPMADPFVLGIHSGAAFGVALVTLIFRGLTGAAVAAVLLSLGSTAAAFAGAAAVTVFMAVLSVRMRSRTALLVAGLMLGYGLNAVISLFIFFSSPREWEWFLSWNFASFSGTRLTEAVLLTAVTAAAGFYAVRMAKNLNLYRLSSDYAVSMGVDVRRLRFGIVAASSVLAAFVTAFCGPTAFVGIAAPRLAVIFFRSDDCRYRVPAAALSGALLTTAADLAAKLPGLWTTALPLNPVLSFFGLPFVFAVLLGERRELSGE